MTYEGIHEGAAGMPDPADRVAHALLEAHLLRLQEAENQIIVDYEVYARRPNDLDLLMPAIEVHAARPAPARCRSRYPGAAPSDPRRHRVRVAGCRR
jgi:hypothetical protein